MSIHNNLYEQDFPTRSQKLEAFIFWQINCKKNHILYKTRKTALVCMLELLRLSSWNNKYTQTKPFNPHLN